MHIRKILIFMMLFLMTASMSISSKEYHVAKNGNDNNDGSIYYPYLTIQAAANVAIAGDTLIVHEGVYRERVNPIKSGINNLNRIVYQAARGEKVVIKGSEIIKGWEKVEATVWRAEVPNGLFGTYNPYSDLVEGDWFNPEGIKHHTGEVFINGKSLFEQNSIEGVNKPKEHSKAVDKSSSLYTWYCEVDDKNTTFWANFHELNPNEELVEINVRPACFYPSQPGIDFITVKGFIMSQAATQWAAPTAEQIGLIGTHWSKGWIIEDNIISNSKSVGITLGKGRATGHNVWMHNKQKDGTTHYNEVILRALDVGWSKENIGSHIIRNNVIHNCGQAGIVGSLGAVFSKIYHNHIYDIYTKRTYSGAELGGIKIHAPIDMLIENNRIHNAFIGIWLDWMAQGTRVTQNLLYDNSHHDLFTEVNHGPVLIDNNMFLTEVGISVQNCSEGVAYIHNLFVGLTKSFNVPRRSTPYHIAHTTKLMGIRDTKAGDNRFYNNIFIRPDGFTESSHTNKIGENVFICSGLNGYDAFEYESFSEANVFFNGAKPYKNEKNSITTPEFKPNIDLEESGDDVFLNIVFDSSVENVKTAIVTTNRLGSTIVSEAVFEQYDGTPYYLNTDFLGEKRNENNPKVGPIEMIKAGENKIRIW